MLHLFLRPLNILSNSFLAKMVTLHSGRNSWPVRTWSIFVQNLPQFFFLSEEFCTFFFDHELRYLRVLEQKCRHCISVKIFDQSDKMAFSYKFYPIYFFILFYIFSIKFSTCFRDLWIYYLLVFMPKWWHCILVEILDLSNLGVFCTNFSWVFFFFFRSKEFSIFFLDHEICNLHVSVQKCWLSIKVEILTQSDKRAFLYKFYPFFFFYFPFFYRIVHLFLSPLNKLSTSFRAKMAILHSGQNSWPVKIRGSFVQILHKFFFLFQMNSSFFSWTTKYAICKFWWKIYENVFQSKYLTSRTKGHFRTNFNRVYLFFNGHFRTNFYRFFFYSFLFFFYRIFHLFLRPLNILSSSFRAKMVILHFGWNSLLVGTRGILVQIFHQFFFFFR